MPLLDLYSGSDRINVVYKGNQRIKQIYKGSEMVWYTYGINDVIFESATPGVTYIDLKTGGKYRITAVGAGGGGCGNGANGNSDSAASGAAGGAIVVDAVFPRGRIGIAVGTGGTGAGGGDYQGPAAGSGTNSHIVWYSDAQGHNETLICGATGGGGGRAWFRDGWSLGTPGTPVAGSYITNVITSVTGSSGTGTSVGGQLCTCPPPISSIPYGNGGNAAGYPSGYAYIGDPGSNGYVKIQFLEDYDDSNLFTYTINPTPSDATVTLTAGGYTQVGNSITVYKGTTVNWSVSKNGYQTQSGTKTINSNTTDNVTLSNQPLYYCYKDTDYGIAYIYLRQKPTVSGTYTIYEKANGDFTQVSSSSQLTYQQNISIIYESETSWYWAGSSRFVYYSAGDLYI